MILSAGRVEAGFRPYVDIRTPMQSATFLLNWGAESVFGHNYLALTWGGLVVSLGGGAVLALLLRRRFPWTTALVLAGAVAVAGLAQHVVVFYNPVGLLCLAVAVVGTANEPRLWRVRSPDVWAVWGALVLGGMNKINFHALAVAVCGVLVLRAWAADGFRRREGFASLGVLALAGVVAPLAIELAWTGASLRQWYENVLVIPGERYEFARRLFDPAVYLRPAHDFHHHVPFKPLTACGVAVVLAVAALVLRARRNAGRVGAAEGLLLATGVVGACAGGVLLTLTNVESILLTTLAFPVLATALWIGFAPREARARFLPAAALLWLVLGGYASWNGSRVLYGPQAPNRAEYVRLEDDAPMFRYLRGVRLDPGLHQSLMRVGTALKGTSAESTEVFFGPAMEWMERPFPKSVIAGMPVWYHSGTALGPEDGPWLIEALEKRGVRRLLMNHNWESWPPAFAEHVRKCFTAERLGPAATLYTRLSDAEIAARTAIKVHPLAQHPTPAHFRGATGSNVFLRGTRFPQEMTLYASPWGAFFGCDGASRWDWRFGVYRLRGAMAATLDADASGPVTACFRILARSEDGAARDVVWEKTQELNPGRPNVSLPFDLSPGGRALEFEIEVPEAAAGKLAAGWRDLRISHSGKVESQPPPPFYAGLSRQAPVTPLSYVPDAKTVENEAPLPSAAERWLLRDSANSNFTAAVDLEPDSATSNVQPVVLALAWYKSGRFEILSERTVDPARERSVRLDGWMPEPQGWVGVITRPADPLGLTGGVHLGELSIR